LCHGHLSRPRVREPGNLQLALSEFRGMLAARVPAPHAAALRHTLRLARRRHTFLLRGILRCAERIARSKKKFALNSAKLTLQESQKGVKPMIQKLSHATLFVEDQDAAKDFYVNKLGFDVRMDETMDNGFRWLTVAPKGQPDFEIVLMKVAVNPF